MLTPAAATTMEYTVFTIDTPWWVDVALFLAAVAFIVFMIVLILRTRRGSGPPPLPRQPPPPERTP